MEFLHVGVLGAVQGLTEFLPISSSGHLWLLGEFFGTQSLTLEVFLHAGSLVAVIAFFWKSIGQIVRGFFHGETFGWKLLLATVLTLPLALVMQRFFLTDLSLRLVAITLLITGALILLAEFLRSKKEQPFSWPVAISLGLVQGIAVLPGISRSGLTIAFLILLGLPRRQSAEISFLLSIPTILGALLFAIADNQNDASLLLLPESWLGFLVSAVAAATAIAWMLRLIRGRWVWFAPYCGVLAGILFFMH